MSASFTIDFFQALLFASFDLRYILSNTLLFKLFFFGGARFLHFISFENVACLRNQVETLLKVRKWVFGIIYKVFDYLRANH